MPAAEFRQSVPPRFWFPQPLQSLPAEFRQSVPPVRRVVSLPDVGLGHLAMPSNTLIFNWVASDHLLDIHQFNEDAPLVPQRFCWEVHPTTGQRTFVNQFPIMPPNREPEEPVLYAPPAPLPVPPPPPPPPTSSEPHRFCMLMTCSFLSSSDPPPLASSSSSDSPPCPPVKLMCFDWVWYAVGPPYPPEDLMGV